MLYSFGKFNLTKIILVNWFSFLALVVSNQILAEKYPFPQNIPYSNLTPPNHKSRDSLNAELINYYNVWKRDYLKSSNGNTPGGGFYIAMKGTGGSGNEITTSEAHGYGMIIFSLMAGYDADAKKIFDGFFNMYDKHRSTGNKELMSWVISESERVSDDQASATDGDMDIAYALLLAHKQWGSNGAINYLGEAKRIIQRGIKISNIDAGTKRTMLGDWDNNSYSTRPSDWMVGHFRSFQKATNDPFWESVHKISYQLYDLVSTQYSPSAGLVPDFVVGATPRPAREYFLEGKTDNDYSWNACRTPLRFALDALHNQDSRARNILQKISDWILVSTLEDPRNIVAGYSLNGDPLVNYSSHAFTAPLLSSAAVSGKEFQSFVNQGWSLISKSHDSYYSDTITLLSMLFMTGNWWAPYDAMLENQQSTTYTKINGVGVRASSHDGHSPSLALDKNLVAESRWSASGIGEWIEFDLGANKVIKSIELAFYRGNIRSANFDIWLGENNSNLKFMGSYTSSGKTEGFEEFLMHYETARYVRIVGNGNSANDWNSIIEARFNEQIPFVSVGNLKVSASSSDSQDHLPVNTLDGSLDGNSRWSAYGKGQWIMFDLGKIQNIQSVKMAFYRGDQRKTFFKILTGKTASDLTGRYNGVSSGQTNNFETFNIQDIEARYIKIVGLGNSVNEWNSLTEVKISTSMAVFKQTFNSMPSGSQWLNMDKSKVVSCGSEQGKCLKITYTPTSKGSDRVGGSQRIPESWHYTLNYDVKFDQGFEFVKGGKLPGLAPLKHITGCRSSVPEGWSARMMWGRQGIVQPYFYQQNRSSACGEGAKSAEPVFIPGKWHALSLRVYVNRDPRESNGSIQVYVDGRKVSENSGLRLRGDGSDDSLINKILFSTFHGGSDSSWSPSKTVYAYFDNFAVYPGLRVRHRPGE